MLGRCRVLLKVDIDDLQKCGRLFADGEAGMRHFRRQQREGEVRTVLHVHGVDVGIGAEREGDGPLTDWLLDRDLASVRVQSFAELAQREGKVERHIRLLAPLAFIPPRTLAAIIDGTGPRDATVTALAQAVPYRWDHSPHGQGSEQWSYDHRPGLALHAASVVSAELGT